MRDKILKIQKLLNEVLVELNEPKSNARDMTMSEFKAFLGDKSNALLLAKRCKIGHSVFLTILNGDRIPVMRDGTKDRILTGLNVRITQ